MALPQSKQKMVLRVVAVSPGDVQPERDLLEKIISELNRGLADEFNLLLELWRWEIDSYPGLHLKGPQGLIDDLMGLEETDIVIGVFWKRFGTPTDDAGSGTEHELQRAWALWQEGGHPQVFIYFNEAPYYPKSSEEAEQSAAVVRFRSKLPKEQLWWPYEGTSKFEDLVRAHLTTFLRQRSKPEHVASAAPTGIFSAPHFDDAIIRRDLISNLCALALRNPSISIEGMPGSGKTYLAASYVHHEERHSSHRSALWYHTPLNGTLDDMFMQFSAIIDFKGLSVESKCRALLSYLRDVSSVLVVDDFHRADGESYSGLLEISNEYGSPATVLLTSRTHINLPRPSRLRIPGFGVEETKSFLIGRGLASLRENDIATLISKTDGLPLAAGLFATLVLDFFHEPAELLAGDMAVPDRVREWFEALSSELPESGRKLLEFLSFSNEPFNRSVVRRAWKHDGSQTVDEAFDDLQRMYLVQVYSPYRWTVHQLIARLCSAHISAEERRQIHLTFAEHYIRGLQNRRSYVADDADLAWKIRSCRHLQEAGEYERSSQTVLEIAPEAKRRGHYASFMQLCAIELRNNSKRDTWIDYHYAHCALITGAISNGLDAITSVQRTIPPSDVDKYLAIMRLHAEILDAMGDFQDAWHLVTSALDAVDPTRAHPATLAHARSIQAMLLTELGRCREAERIGLELLAQASTRGDKRGGAVALMRLGIIHEEEGDDEEAREKLSQAIALFREVHDRRGTAWGLSELARTTRRLGRSREAVRHLREALRIRSDIGECSRGYLRFLIDMQDFHREPLLSSELSRVRANIQVQ